MLHTNRHLTWLAVLFCCIIFSTQAFALADKENQGRWETPTKNKPDAEVPGFLVNLGPTGARAILTDKTFVVRYIFKDAPALGQLKLNDEKSDTNLKYSVWDFLNFAFSLQIPILLDYVINNS